MSEKIKAKVKSPSKNAVKKWVGKNVETPQHIFINGEKYACNSIVTLNDEFYNKYKRFFKEIKND